MKSTGIVRIIDDLGRIVIPKDIRSAMNISIGDPFEFYYLGRECLVLQKYDCTLNIMDAIEKLEDALNNTSNLACKNEMKNCLDLMKALIKLSSHNQKQK